MINLYILIDHLYFCLQKMRSISHGLLVLELLLSEYVGNAIHPIQ